MRNTTPLLNAEEDNGKPRGKFNFVKFSLVLLAACLLVTILVAERKPSTGNEVSIALSETPLATCGCVAKCGCKKKKKMPVDNCVCESLGKRPGARGKLKKWVDLDKKGHLKNSQRSGIKHALRQGEIDAENNQKKDDQKKKTENGENDIQEDDPRGFVVYKKKVVLKLAKKDENDAMTMARRPKRLRKNDKKKKAIDWAENHEKDWLGSYNNDVKKVDGQYGFHHSRLKGAAIPINRVRMLGKTSKSIYEQSLAESGIQAPNGSPEDQTPAKWVPIMIKDN